MRRTRASYLPDNFVPLAEAGVLELVDDDQTIMPGVRVQRTGGHTRHHQMVLDRVERAARRVSGRPDADLGASLAAVDCRGRPVSGGHAGREAGVRRRKRCAQHTLVFFEHDPQLRAAYIVEQNGKANPLQPL